MQTTLVLAMTVDGKIAHVDRSAAKFSSRADFRHMEAQVAQADAVLIGAGSLRIHGTTMRVLDPALIQARIDRGLSPQPVQIVCSRSGDISPHLRFFQQPVPRWLLTTVVTEGQGFDRVLQINNGEDIDWQKAWQELERLGIDKLCVLGGAAIATALWEQDLIDKLQITVCPIVLGGAAAPSPCMGNGLTVPRQLKLISQKTIGQEIFLEYHRTYQI